MDMENPFYYKGLSKLPLETLCVSIEKNLLEILFWAEQYQATGKVKDAKST